MLACDLDDDDDEEEEIDGEMWPGSTSKLKQTRDGEDLMNPTALTNYYMDTFLCHDYQLKEAVCSQEYAQMSTLRFWKRRSKHKECMNYMDEFKACIIGINQQQIGQSQRQVLSESQLY